MTYKTTILYMLIALSASASAIAQTADDYNQVVWFDDKMQYANPIPSFDSITYSDDAGAQDTLFLFLPRRVSHIQHDTIVICVHDTVYLKGSKGIGKYSVSADKQVSFAPGNLQYHASSQTWRFATNQYDTIGSANSNISATYDGWIDLFGWGTRSNPTNTSVDYSDYPAFADWGINTIGTDVPHFWRTLTAEEWEYLFMHTRWTMARVNGVLGFMLLPDHVAIPSDITLNLIGDGNLSDNHLPADTTVYASNNYTVSQFSQLETLGCVFLPCAGYRKGQRIYDVGTHGCYWSTTSYGDNNAKDLYFYATYISTHYWGNRDSGQSVRLVQNLR